MQLAAYSHPGRRPENQDCVRIERLTDGRILAAVADGMGGHQGGAHASRRALEVIAARLEAGDDIARAAGEANRVLNHEARHPDLAGMGTTAVGLLHDAAGYRVFNVGDSRCYRISEAGIAQVSFDHSFVADALRNGTMERDQAEATPWKNALTRSLGGEACVEVDQFGPFPDGDPQVVLFCSDGVYKSVPDELIDKIIRGTPDVTTAARALVDVAFRRGSDDNLSAVLLEFGSLPRAAEWITLPTPVTVWEDVAPARATAVGDEPAGSSATRIEWPAERDKKNPVGSATRSTKGAGIGDRKRVSRSIPLAAAVIVLVGLAIFAVTRWTENTADERAARSLPSARNSAGGDSAEQRPAEVPTATATEVPTADSSRSDSMDVGDRDSSETQTAGMTTPTIGRDGRRITTIGAGVSAPEHAPKH